MYKFLAAGALMMAGIAQADPLAVRDLNPLLAGYELPPALPSSATDGLQAEFAIANITLAKQSSTESLQMDAELRRWQLSVTKSFADWNLQLELPLLKISGGGLDRFIESWHRTFGLPNGNRAGVPRNRLLIRHVQAGVVDQQLQTPAQGLGDTTLRLGHSLGLHNSMLWLSLKLPTGKTSLGSGAADVALSFATGQTLSQRFSAHQQLSISVLGKGDRLRDQQRATVWSGTIGMDARITAHWFATMQLDAHSKVFDSDLRVLGNALQLSFGPRYESRYWQTSLLVSEDIAVDTAPDVQFQIDVKRRF